MPGMGRTELDPHRQRAPIRGQGDAHHRLAAVALKNEVGGQGQPRVLSKPVHPKDLIRAVDRLLAD
jgi:hypothetical protein